MLNIHEASTYTGMAEKTLYEKARMKMIPYFKIGRSIRFDQEDLDNWLNQFKQDAVNQDLLESH